MIYGSNILSSVVANWQVTNGTVTTDSITLEAGGYAVQNIDLAVLQSIPEYMLLSVVATSYADPYAMGLIAELKVLSETGVMRVYTIPIVDTGNGVCLVDFPTEAIDHASLTFTFRSTAPVVISEYSLFPPKMSDVDLTEVLDRLPRLLNDYNETPVVVGQAEDIVALISAYVTETTELTGKFTLSYVASEPTEVIIRIKDNEISELYTPMTFKLAPGRGTIGIPHGYLVKRQGYHTFTVTAQVTSGSLSVDTRQVMYIIDGGRIAYGVMDVGAIAYDVTVRKLATETQISYIYAICIDEGICSVKRAEYTESPGAAWATVAIIGPAIDAAIEFDGAWAFNRHPYTFNTDENPWVSWVAPDGTLYAKKLYSETAPIVMSTNVTHISMVRGWNNTFVPGQDHGMILLYIKNGVPYYRTYAKQTTGDIVWEAERPLAIFSGTAVDINGFRTNDYRVGINILDTDNNTHTYMTPRNWVGIALEAHIIAVTAKAEVAFTEVTYHPVMHDERLEVSATADVTMLFGRTDNTVVELENLPITKTDEFGQEYQDWGFKVRVRLNFESINVPTFTLTDATTLSGIAIASVTVIEQGYEYMLDIDDTVHEFGLNEVEANVILAVSSFTNEAGYEYDVISQEFTPVNLVPPALALPEVEVIWNE